jgi:hypothetical protein
VHAGRAPRVVSDGARRRQHNEMGTLGSGNHYLEVQRVAEVFAPQVASASGLAREDVVVAIHCGSRGWAIRSGPSTSGGLEAVAVTDGASCIVVLIGPTAQTMEQAARAQPHGGQTPRRSARCSRGATRSCGGRAATPP